MKKIRLMQITHDLAVGGLQQVVVNLCKAINKDRFDVSVLCLRALGEYVPEVEKLGIKVINIAPKKGADYFLFLKIAKILRDEKIDVIHTHNSQPFIDGTLAALFSGVKIIIHSEHGRIFPDKKRYMIAEWIVSHFVNKIVGVSKATSENMIRYLKINPKKVTTIINGIDGSQFNITIDRGLKRKELGIDKNAIVIGSMGRLVIEKGYTYMIDAMRQIIPIYSNAKLVIVGQGYGMKYLQNYVRELNLEDFVIFTGNRMDIAELLKTFDLLVLSSISEGLPIVLLEGLAAKCPIVATDVGGVSQVITHGVNGSLVPAEDSKKLAEEIIKLLPDKKTQIKYTTNGVKIFRKKFDVSIMVQKYESLYRGNDGNFQTA